MIIIRENIPKKISGITSLFITFDYSQDIVNVIKSFECKSWDKKTLTWELPVSYLPDLVKSLTKLDDIQIYPFEEEIKQPETYELLSYKTKSFEHQLEAVQYGLNRDNWLLLDVPGLGKSKTIINLIEELKSKRGLGKSLIICGVNSLKSNWVNEIHKHSNLACKILGTRYKKNGNAYVGTLKDRLEDLQNPIEEDIIITNIETIREDSIIKELQKGLFDLICVDEIHACKSSTSIQGKHLLKLNAKYKIGLTGTILLNNPLDLYVPLKFIGAEKGTLTNFKQYYCKFGGFRNSQVVGYQNIEALKDELESCSLRRTKDLLNLPQKNIIEEYIDMYDSQAKFYEDITKGIISECDKADLSRMTILSSIGRLRQVTVYPGMLTTQNIPSAKLDRALDLIQQITENGDKVVVFSTFKEPVYYLSERVSNSVIVTGNTPDKDTFSHINKFQSENDCKVFIGTWQKCGTGITLTAARYMIFLDTPYTDGIFQQACDRIHRIGTTEPVFIYNLICKNTVDERVKSLVDNKRYLSDFIVDDIQNDEIIRNLRDYLVNLG